MKAIIIHIYREMFGFKKRPSFIFESYLGITVFERALHALSGTKQYDAVYFVCPSSDRDFFASLLSPVKNKSAHLEWNLQEVGEDHPGAMTSGNIRFDPLKWVQQDTFGLWTFEGWEALTVSSRLSTMLLFNLESFWYLDSRQYDELALMMDKGDFVLNGDTPEDVLLGVDVKQLRYRKTRYELTRKKQIQNRIHNFSTDLYNAPLPENNSLKIQRESLDRLQKAPLLLKDFVRTEEASGLPPLIHNFKKNLQSALPCISLREINGLKRLRTFEKDLKSFENKGKISFCERNYFKGPRSFRIEGDLTHFSEDEFKEFIRIWKDVPFFRYIEGPPLPCARIRALKDEIEGIIWLESSFSGRNRKDLEEIYLSGITGFVLKADMEPEPFSFSALEEKMDLLRFLKQNHPEIFFLVKIDNREDFQKKISGFIQRFQYTTDGIVLTGEALPNAYRVRDFRHQCTRVPYEIVLRNEKFVALCSRAQNEFSALRRDQWAEESACAGQRPECTDCRMRLDFGISPSYYSFYPEGPQILKSEILKNAAFWGEKYRREEKFIDALRVFETILKINPLNSETWAAIDEIEKKTRT